MFKMFKNPLNLAYDANLKNETLSILRFGQVYASFKLDEEYKVVQTVGSAPQGDSFLNSGIKTWSGQLQKYAEIVTNHGVTDRTEILKGFYKMLIQSFNRKNLEPKGKK
jgi:hypothetical protein